MVHMVGINSIYTFVNNVCIMNIICIRIFFHPFFSYIRLFSFLKNKHENPILPMIHDFLMFKLIIMFASCFKWVTPKRGGVGGGAHSQNKGLDLATT